MVKLTPVQINKLYEFIGEIPPENVTEQDISQILIDIEKKFTPDYYQRHEDNNLKNNRRPNRKARIRKR